MSAARLKKWMEKNNKNVIDVASLTKLSLNTVKNYLDEKAVHRSTEAALERMLEDSEETRDHSDKTA